MAGLNSVIILRSHSASEYRFAQQVFRRFGATDQGQYGNVGLAGTIRLHPNRATKDFEETE
jgi:hypothetical protein